MNGCVYRTADNQCEKFSDPVRNTLSWCVGDTPCEARKLSNADRIRQMTDEELEQWFWWAHKEMMSYTDSVLWLREWLKKEVDDDNKQA